jgi:predicted nuclease with TOPRIM domain
VAQLKDLRHRLDQAQEEGQETKELLRKFTQGEEDPARLINRLKQLEAENEELLERLKRGKVGVERLLARIRFLEEQG